MGLFDFGSKETPEAPADNPQGAATGSADSAPPGQFEQLGNQLAAKHAASSTGTKRGGRKTAAEETADYLSRNGLRAVPLGENGDSNFDQGSEQGSADASEQSGQCGSHYVVTPEFIRTCAQTLFEGIEESRKRKVFLLVEQLDPSMAQELSDQAGAPPGTINTMSLCCEEIARKHQDWVSKFGPEGVLGGAIIFWIFKDRQLMKKLSQLARVAAPLANEAQAPASAPSMRNDT